jgi:hypothetical protein
MKNPHELFFVVDTWQLLPCASHVAGAAACSVVLDEKHACRPNIAQAIATSIIDLIIGLADSLLPDLSPGFRRSQTVANVSLSSSITDAEPVRNPPRHSPPPLEKEAPRTPRTARQRLAIVVTRIAVLTPMIIADRVV